MVKGREGVNGGRGAKAACGGVRRRRRSGEAQGLGRPSEERWAGGPRERGEGSNRAQPSLATVRATVRIRSEHGERRRALPNYGFSVREQCLSAASADNVCGSTAKGRRSIQTRAT